MHMVIIARQSIKVNLLSKCLQSSEVQIHFKKVLILQGSKLQEMQEIYEKALVTVNIVPRDFALYVLENQEINGHNDN
jgi:hypothetical protein